MVYKSHLVELFVNGEKMELESQESLNLRFNNTLYDPEKVASTQAEYSFEFEIPSTPHNDKVFDYANNLSKLNKFHIRWNAQVYADGTNIFDGTLTLNGFKDKKYQCNLVSVKVYSLEDIFGESVMTEIPWSIPFDGIPTINAYNAGTSGNSEVCFPLVSYGVFEKDPYYKDEIASDYTSKFEFDQYNKWYVESFYPSLKMLETLKKAFEYKGYTVGGDIFEDDFLNNIYMSCNLADEQSPDYNLGNPRFGKVDLNVSWMTDTELTPYIQNLNFPYFRIGGGMDADGKFVNSRWNFEGIQVYDMLGEGNVHVNSSSYLYEPDEHIIVIPSDGFYKITLSGTARVTTTNSFRANQICAVEGFEYESREVDIPINARKFTPFEIQLVKNYDDNIELIKGENNFILGDGVPTNQYVMDSSSLGTNYFSIYSCFPHEKCGRAWYYGDTAALHGAWLDWVYAPPTDITKFGDELSKGLYNFDEGNNMGYLFNDGDIMAYDPVVNPNFIAGFTSMGNDNGGGCPAVIKNGYSWSKTVSERYNELYKQQGYWKANTTYRTGSAGRSAPDWNITTTPSGHNKNNYIDSFSYFSSNNTTINGQIQCLVHLNKNDILQLFAIQRDYSLSGESQQYTVLADYNLSIEAITPKSTYDSVKSYSVNQPTEFDENLKLSNFLNKETKISDWVQNVVDAFNLEVIQNGNTVEINTKKKLNQNLLTAVELDNRVNSAEAESQAIDYPRSMAIKYKIDADEWGFERSAVEANGGSESILDNPNWKDYANSGYTVIELNDDAYQTKKSEKSLQFSYTWYDNFVWKEVDYNGIVNPNESMTLRIPVISKYTYMINGYSYEESMKHDGFGQAQRFWFKPVNHPYMNGDLQEYAHVWSNTYPKEKIYLYTSSNVYNDTNLSYKKTEKSLLDRYFNIVAYLSSNYVIVEAYLNAEEYKMVKNGALLHFDSDLYYPVEISGYDPSGNNPTEIKMMKKI